MMWLLSPIGRWLSAIGAAIAALAGVYLFGRREGAQRAREADYQRGREIRESADEILRKHDGDFRPVDERLRSKGHLRD